MSDDPKPEEAEAYKKKAKRPSRTMDAVYPEQLAWARRHGKHPTFKRGRYAIGIGEIVWLDDRTQSFFYRTKSSEGTEFASIEFKDLGEGLMYESELAWGPKGDIHTKPWKNAVPRNAKSHFLECEACAWLPRLKCEAHGQMKLRKGGMLAQRYVFTLPSGKTKRWTDIFSPGLWERGYERTLKIKIKAQALALIKETFYPFDLDGRNLGKGDLAHCIVCGYSILVLEVDAGRIAYRPDGSLAFRALNMMEDQRKLFKTLRRAIVAGDYELVKQRAESKRYLRCFAPHSETSNSREQKG